MSAVKDLRIYQAAREAAYGTAIATDTGCGERSCQ